MTKSTFSVHPQLLNDCHHLGVSDHFHLLLHKNANIPWLILVPETDVKEIYQLPQAMQETFLALTTHISDYFMTSYQAQKMNIAAIGNVVEQLHIHVIARRSDDACWPDAVWGRDYPAIAYTKKQMDDLIRFLNHI